MNIEKVVKEGDKLRETFLEAQEMKQETDALYREAHAAYAGWVETYGDIAKAVAKTVRKQAAAEARVGAKAEATADVKEKG